MLHLRRMACLAAWLWLAGSFAVCSAQILNSERIEQVFGSYGIDVLYSDRSLRLADLYSEHDGNRVTRTVAIVGYPQEIVPAFADQHRQILAGGSIGATFTAAGWDVVKRNLSIATTEAAPALAAAMGVDAGSPLAVHAYELAIERGGERHAYSVIIEIHHPQYLREEQLREIYLASGPADDEMTGAALALFSDGIATLSRLRAAP